MAYVLLYPMLVMLSRAIRPASDMLNSSIVWIPSHISTLAFKTAWEYMDFGKTALSTGYLVIGSTLFSVISCSFAGYSLGRYRLKITAPCVVVAVLSLIAPLQTYIIPRFVQMKNFDFFGIGTLLGVFNGGTPITYNILNTPWAYFLPAITGAGLQSGLFVLVFSQVFRKLPKELEDAARIDGCGEFHTFIRIMVPNAGSGFLAVSLLSLVWYWNDYFYAEMMYRSVQLLSSKLVSLRATVHQNSISKLIGHNDGLTESVIIFAGALLFVIPPLLIYLFLQKYFIQGIERSGIVG
jgi:multiple sugar transport system permease protein